MKLIKYSATLFIVILVIKLSEKKSESNFTEICPNEIVKIFK